MPEANVNRTGGRGGQAPVPGIPGGPGGPGGPGPGAMRGMMPKVRPKDAKGTIRRLWDYLRRQRTGLILVFVLTAIGAGLGLIGPYLIGTAIDKYILPGDV